MTKTATPKEKSKKESDNTKTPPKNSLTQRLRTDLGRSVELIILVYLNRFTGSQPSHEPQKLCNQKDTYLKILFIKTDFKYQNIIVLWVI